MYNDSPVFWWGFMGFFGYFFCWVFVVVMVLTGWGFFRFLMLMPGCSGINFHLSTISVSVAYMTYFMLCQVVAQHLQWWHECPCSLWIYNIFLLGLWCWLSFSSGAFSWVRGINLNLHTLYLDWISVFLHDKKTFTFLNLYLEKNQPKQQWRSREEEKDLKTELHKMTQTFISCQHSRLGKKPVRKMEQLFLGPVQHDPIIRRAGDNTHHY